jgi:drug/metabolite transporter (DMT)-like permease
MQSNQRFPELIVAVASAAWGLFWIPLRAFESQGLAPAWATLAQFLAPLLALLPLAVYRLAHRMPAGAQQYQTGLLMGSAVALYLQSLLLTDVARALILFYAMPAWGTLVEVSLLHRPFTKRRALALLLSLSGMLAILSAHGGSSTSANLGDLLALVSGIIFSLRSSCMVPLQRRCWPSCHLRHSFNLRIRQPSSGYCRGCW